MTPLGEPERAVDLAFSGVNRSADSNHSVAAC